MLLTRGSFDPDRYPKSTLKVNRKTAGCGRSDFGNLSAADVGVFDLAKLPRSASESSTVPTKFTRYY